jgi:hypothetical protein
MHVYICFSNAQACLETREPSCVPMVAKHFFIPVVHSPLGAVGHVTVPELPSQEGRARIRETRDSNGSHLVTKAMSGAEGHVTASELTSVRR